MNLDEVKELFQKAIEESANMNEALEKLCQFIYQKGYEDGKSAVSGDTENAEIIDCLEQIWCEEGESMTVDEYRKKLIDIFHNSNRDELISLIVPATKEDFRLLKWMLDEKPQLVN